MREDMSGRQMEPQQPQGIIPFERGDFRFCAHPDPDLEDLAAEEMLAEDSVAARPLAILAHHEPTGLEFQFTLDAPWSRACDWDVILDHRTAGPLSLGRIEQIKRAAEALLLGFLVQSRRQRA